MLQHWFIKISLENPRTSSQRRTEVSSNTIEKGNRAPQTRPKTSSWSLLEITRPVWQSDLMIRVLSGLLLSFLSFNILLSLLTHQQSVCLLRSHFCLHHWKYKIFILDSDNTFSNICFTSTNQKQNKTKPNKPQNAVRGNILIAKENKLANQA